MHPFTSIYPVQLWLYSITGHVHLSTARMWYSTLSCYVLLGFPDGFPDFRGARALHCTCQCSTSHFFSSPKESHSEYQTRSSCFPPLDTAFFPSPCPRATPYWAGQGGPEARAASDESYVSAWHSDGGAHPRIKNNHKSALLEFFFWGGQPFQFHFPHSSLPFTFTFCYHYYCQLADHDLT